MKKEEAEYTVRYFGQRVVDQYRGDRTLGRIYTVTKFMPRTNEMTEYEVVLSELYDSCTCPASRRPDCKHRKMAREFQASASQK